MKSIQLVLLSVCLVVPTVTSSQDHPAPEASVAVFERILTERFAATANADAKTYTTFVAPDAVFVDDYGVEEDAAQHIATIGRRGVGRSRSRSTPLGRRRS